MAMQRPRPNPRHLRIFLSSPGDVLEERAIARNILGRLPYDPLLRGKITIEVVAWDEPGAGVPMFATTDPQDAVNMGLPTPAECDVVVVIFWERMGTPLQTARYKKPDGSQYMSGTEWEYENALEAHGRLGMPYITVYRRESRFDPDTDAPEPDEKREQRQRVQKFFEQFRNPEDGSLIRGYNPYKDTEEFADIFQTHMKGILQRILAEPATRTERLKKELASDSFPDSVDSEAYSAEFLRDFVLDRLHDPWLRAKALELCFARALTDDVFIGKAATDDAEVVLISLAKSVAGHHSLVPDSVLSDLIKDQRLDVSKQTVRSMCTVVRNGGRTSSYLAPASASRYWEVKYLAVQTIMNTDDDEAMKALMAFKSMSYHKKREKVILYIRQRHKNGSLADSDLSRAIEILQQYLDDGKSSERIRKMAQDTMDCLTGSE